MKVNTKPIIDPFMGIPKFRKYLRVLIRLILKEGMYEKVLKSYSIGAIDFFYRGNISLPFVRKYLRTSTEGWEDWDTINMNKKWSKTLAGLIKEEIKNDYDEIGKTLLKYELLKNNSIIKYDKEGRINAIYIDANNGIFSTTEWRLFMGEERIAELFSRWSIYGAHKSINHKRMTLLASQYLPISKKQ